MRSEQWQSDFATSTHLQKWLLVALEVALNKGLEIKPGLQAHVAQNAGKVIAVKARDPYCSVYLVLKKDGFCLLGQYQGQVDARLRMQSRDLAWFLLGPEFSREGHVPNYKMVGDEQLVSLVQSFVAEWDFWETCRGILKEWMPEIETLEGLFESLGRQDPAWVAHLERVPELMQVIVLELKDHARLLEHQVQGTQTMQTLLKRQQYQLALLTLVVLGLGLGMIWS